MKTEVKKLDTTKREIQIEVSGEVVHNKFEDVFKKIAKEAKVPGFRAGNVPRYLLEKNYSSHAHEMVMKELIPETYDLAIEKEALDVVELPHISEVKLDRSNLSFKAVVEVRPEIKLKNYKGIKVEYAKSEVSAEDLAHHLDGLKAKLKIEKIDDAVARSLCYPNMAEFEKSITHQLLVQKETQSRQKIEDAIVEGLLKDVEFKLPEALLERQLQEMLRQTKLDLALKGVAREELDKYEKEMRNDLEPQARKQVKIYLILAEIAKKENIPVDDQMPRKVIEFLLKEADWKEM